MSMLFLNIILALLWAALTGSFTEPNLAVGFFLGLLVVWLSQRSMKTPAPYVLKLILVAEFSLFFLWELMKANLRVAFDVLTPRHYMRPGIIAIPLEVKSDLEIMMLTTLITLTPGTLSLDVSLDRETLYIHAMYIDDRKELERTIKYGYERRVRRVCRWS